MKGFNRPLHPSSFGTTMTIYKTNTCCRLVVASVVIALASAYINNPSPLTQRCMGHRHKHRFNYIQHEANSKDESKKNQQQASQSLARPKNKERFCSLIGCTLHDYDWTIEQLRRRKIELSKEMLQVSDDLRSLQQYLTLGESIQHDIHRMADQIFEHTKALSSWWMRDAPNNQKSLNHHQKEYNGLWILEERRTKLSSRALAIQNLLLALNAMENNPNPMVWPNVLSSIDGIARSAATTPQVFTKELAEQYRNVVLAEGIGTFQGRFSAPFQHHPRPPLSPPTIQQFEVGRKNDIIFYQVLL